MKLPRRIEKTKPFLLSRYFERDFEGEIEEQIAEHHSHLHEKLRGDC